MAAYTPTLRDGGMAPKQVLAAINAVVHEAGRHCVAAYFAR